MNEGNIQTRRRNVRWALGLSAVLIVIAGFVYSASQSPIPDVSQVNGMRAALLVDSGRLEFSVPPEHWESVLNALKPCEADLFPAKWQGLGFLAIDRTGPDLAITLFETGELGAFADNGIVFRAYYRGGNSTTLRQVLLKAYEASEDRKSESMKAK